jgi:DNA-binding MarR family transcriptional regulator
VKFPSHEAVNGYTGFLLRKVSAATFTRFAAEVEQHGLHPMHFGMLTIIEAEEPISQGELSKRTGIDPSTMVARMDVLDNAGYVERTRGSVDRRSYEIRLTDAGRALLAELRERAEQIGDEFFSPLSAAERQQLHELLTKLADAIDE